MLGHPGLLLELGIPASDPCFWAPRPGAPSGYADVTAALALALALGSCDLGLARGRSRPLPCCQVSMETAWAIFSTLHPRLPRRSCFGFSLQDPTGGSHLPEVKPWAVAAILRGDITGTGPAASGRPHAARRWPWRT